MNVPSSRLLPKIWQVPDTILERLGNNAGRQRIMDEEGHLLLILHAAPEASDDAERTAAFFWRNPEGEWKSAPNSGGVASLKDHLDCYRKHIFDLDEQVEAAQKATEYFSILKNATPLLRATRHMLEVLQKAREARQDDRQLLLMRDEAVELERAIDLVHADARDGMEFVIAENASEQAELSYQATVESRRLNRLVAFFFPMATLISLFGMNSPKEVLKSGALWWVVGLGIILGCLVGLGFRKKTRP